MSIITTTPDQSVVPSDLPRMAQAINHQHKLCLDAMNAGLDHAHEAGKLLVRAKKQIGHGEWSEWLDAHFDGSRRSAQVYMRVAKCWPEIEAAKAQTSALFSLDAANRLLTAPKPEPDPVDQTPVDWFLEDGLLNQEHAHELLQIREAIGEGVMAEFRVMRTPLTDASDAAIVLYRLGPEQKTTVYEPNETVLVMLNRFFDYSNGRGGKVPQWEVVAFWWACLAVQTDIRAGQLARAIDSWLWRFHSAVAYVWFRRKGIAGGETYRFDGDTNPKAETLWYWGSVADLNHAGVLDTVVGDDGASDLVCDAFATVCRHNCYAAPSEVNKLLRDLEDGADMSEPERKSARILYYHCHGELFKGDR